MAGDEGWRKIKLFCPSVSKILDLVTWNEQKLDFGSIAAAFGLQPSTVKLNGYFISRDIDLISSCVTWQSLLAFFSAKGFSTGKNESDALLVDGKLSKVGTKRAHSDSMEDVNCNHLGVIKNKKFKDKFEILTSSSFGDSKRKLLSEEDSHSLKKVKLNIDDSFGKIGVSDSGSPLKCSLMSDGLKRIREDDMIGSVSCKKIR